MMTAISNFNELLKPGLLGHWIAERPIWQMRLLDHRELSQFSKDRGFDFWPDHIIQLWQMKLLRADLVRSRRKLRWAGLVLIGKDDYDRYIYADERRPQRHRQGWGHSRSKLKPLPTYIELVFHPFRYYVLINIKRIIQLSINPMQIFTIDKYPTMLERETTNFQVWSASANFTNLIDRWNDLTAFAVSTEPITFTQIFGEVARPAFIDENIFDSLMDTHRKEMFKIYKSLDLDRINEARMELCISAELLDKNRNIHTMLRIAKNRSRLRIVGKIGGAIHLLLMAEMIRRAAEHAFKIELPEEDELGFASWIPGSKKEIYGSNCILNGDPNVKNEFLREFGLDYGVRLNWYVEGETEYGALHSIFEIYRSGVEVINLRGRVGKKGFAAFRDGLQADKGRGIFSFVSLDGDRSDHLRTVRKAAIDDEICGEFFVSNPDFEFGNFTLEELEEILWQIAKEKGADDKDRQRLHQSIKNVTSGKELLTEAQRALNELFNVSKGSLWGEHLMQFAWENPKLPDGSKRLIIKAVEKALRIDSYDYKMTLEKYRVDPDTGRLVERI